MRKKLVVLLMVSALGLTGCGPSLAKEVKELVKQEKPQKNETAQEDEKPQENETLQGEGETQKTTVREDEDVPDDGQEAAVLKKGGSYTWQEITVTFPENWADKCLIMENETGFSVYQKASYEKENGMGFICGFSRLEEAVYYGCGETMLGYTDDGVFYYINRPTDVPCDISQESIMNEYTEMSAQSDEVEESARFNVPGIHYDVEEYIIPSSSICLLQQEMLYSMSDNDLWIAKNEIYARHGRKFGNDYLQRYFNQCSWYQGTISAKKFDDAVLNEIEKKNVELLSEAKKEYARKHPYPKKYQVGETVREDLDGTGTYNEIRYQVNELPDRNYECLLTIDGETYAVGEVAGIWTPCEDRFYVTDISEYDETLEIAILDYGPSDDLVTYFFKYDGDLYYLGLVEGFPFAEENGGINGFDGYGNITGQLRVDLIETAETEGQWRYNGTIDYQETEWHKYIPKRSHILYENLPVYSKMDETSVMKTIPAQNEVFFMGTDLTEWILVKGKDGSSGYMRIVDGKITALNKKADGVFSDLYYYD